MFCSKKKPTTCSSLLERRTTILSVFTKTRDELIELLEDQHEYAQNLTDQIQALNIEKTCTDIDIKESQSILTKINNFLK
jgi:hypothetical protein